MSKNSLLLTLLLLLVVPAAAQEQSATTRTFRFMHGHDGSAPSWNGDGSEHERLLAGAAGHEAATSNQEIAVETDGYCNALAAESAGAERPAAPAAEAHRDGRMPDAGTHSAGCGWYAGIQGGIPFGASQFSSFGADRTRAGFSAGILGGYRFNRVLALEAQAAWGRVNLSARDCCPDYWMGSDGMHYEAAVAGMEGWDYSTLRSRVFTQSYGVQLNVNLLGFFPAMRDSRWTLELAPRIAVIGMHAAQFTLEDDRKVFTGDTHWHFGAGGSLQAAYRITEHLGLGIHTGMIGLTGKPLDGMPEHLHKANYIWESGLRLSWFFHK